ncbi:mCG54495, isoform CRA_a [Mus musculus]|nr:mCG54495, isoform CRA_a [Mus musculus]
MAPNSGFEHLLDKRWGEITSRDRKETLRDNILAKEICSTCSFMPTSFLNGELSKNEESRYISSRMNIFVNF